MGSKSEMLAAIRGALGRVAADTTPPPSWSPATSTATSTREDLVDQFCAELKNVGGRTIPVQSAEEARDYIEDLLSAYAPNGQDARSVAVSDGAHRRAPRLREWLQDRGFALIPSLRERPSTDAGEYKRDLFASSMGVTTADFAIADTGTLVLVSERNPQALSNGIPHERGSGGDQHRLISLVPPIHVCLLDTNRILPNLAELITHVDSTYYRAAEPPLGMTFITGPSRTADIELTLTMGVHGPRELHVLLMQNC